jgi:hypothetical protein
MDILRVPTGSIEQRHQPVDPLAGAMRSTVIVALAALGSCVAEVEGMRLHARIRERGLSPGPSAP